jgi:hypothetical protein
MGRCLVLGCRHKNDSPVMRIGLLPYRLLAGCAFCAFLGTGAGIAHGQPFGYAVNAADPTNDGSHDNLWRVNLGTGSAERIGPLNLPSAGNPQSDVEGLALETSSFLYGVDDATDSLNAISVTNGTAIVLDRPLDNLRLSLGGNPLDPGLGFDCDGRLLMSSATRRTLYRVNKLTGQATVVGSEGALGARIADIAVRGEEIFGIGVAGDEGLYRIDGSTGAATRVGSFDPGIRLAGAGLDFDSSGKLWAIGHVVDGQGQPQPSRILEIDRETGAAELGPASRVGFKSLAITSVRCGPFGTPPPQQPAIAAPVGSPATLAILATLLLGTAWRLRRRLRPT